jgi:hypothetical protein
VHTLQFTFTYTLVFSVFISRILTTDLGQSHRHCSMYEVSFSHPDSFLAIILPTNNSGNRHNSNSNFMRFSLNRLGVAPTGNTAYFVVACWVAAAEMCLRHNCLQTNDTMTTEITALLFLREFAAAGMCLPSRCLANDNAGFQASYHNIQNCKFTFRFIWVWNSKRAQFEDEDRMLPSLHGIKMQEIKWGLMKLPQYLQSM